ncbi:MAG TPA: hypothetical protein VMI74_07840 [Burkholderiales bacterium]|nr:hypothetical protein [Burkholderiales bacterium]
MRPELPQHAEIEAAFAQVLQAERDAEAELARCKDECAAEIAHAKRQAEAIAARAERRIGILNRGRAEAVERRIAELGAAAAAGGSAPRSGDGDVAGLARAAQALARELTGAGT